MPQRPPIILKRKMSGGVEADVDRLYISDSLPLGAPRYEYHPLEKGLFLTFSHLDLTQKDTWLGFANKHGLLLPYRTSRLIHIDNSQRYAVGEPFHFWWNAISDMQAGVELWESLRRGDTRELRRVIKWEYQKGRWAVFYQRETDPYGRIWKRVIAAPLISSERLEGLIPARGKLQTGWVASPKIVKQAGWLALQDLVNAEAAGTLSVHTEVEPGGSGLRMAFRPQSLRDALWIQLGQEITNNNDLRRCQRCRKPFLLASGARRTNSKWCGGTCKTAAHRTRQEEKCRTQKK
jgi:hypothetical protein